MNKPVRPHVSSLPSWLQPVLPIQTLNISPTVSYSYPSRACPRFTGLLINFRSPYVWRRIGDHCWWGECLTVWWTRHSFLEEEKQTKWDEVVGRHKLHSRQSLLCLFGNTNDSPCFPSSLPSCQTYPWTLHPANIKRIFTFLIWLNITYRESKTAACTVAQVSLATFPPQEIVAGTRYCTAP